jgi:hypothetical protein
MQYSAPRRADRKEKEERREKKKHKSGEPDTRREREEGEKDLGHVPTANYSRAVLCPGGAAEGAIIKAHRTERESQYLTCG